MALIKFNCAHCGNACARAAWDVNRARAKDYNLYCNKRCSGLARRKHGQIKTRLYNIWSGMAARCGNPKDPSYPRYGGRGVSVCSAWRASFETFRDWALANDYRSDLTIDRIDNYGNYEPNNCRWATYAQQNRNKCNNKPVIFQGETLLIFELAERCGLSADLLKNRIGRLGWSVEAAVSTPIHNRGQRRAIIKATEYDTVDRADIGHKEES